MQTSYDSFAAFVSLVFKNVVSDVPLNLTYLVFTESSIVALPLVESIVIVYEVRSFRPSLTFRPLRPLVEYT